MNEKITAISWWIHGQNYGKSQQALFSFIGNIRKAPFSLFIAVRRWCNGSKWNPTKIDAQTLFYLPRCHDIVALPGHAKFWQCFSLGDSFWHQFFLNFVRPDNLDPFVRLFVSSKLRGNLVVAHPLWREKNYVLKLGYPMRHAINFTFWKCDTYARHNYVTIW